MATKLRAALLAWVGFLLVVQWLLGVGGNDQGNDGSELRKVSAALEEVWEGEVQALERAVTETGGLLQEMANLTTLMDPGDGLSDRLRSDLLSAFRSAQVDAAVIDDKDEGGAAMETQLSTFLPTDKVGPVDDLRSFLLKLLHSVGAGVDADFEATVKGLVLEQDLDWLEKVKGTLVVADYRARRDAIERRMPKYAKHPVLRAVVIAHFRLYEGLQYKRRIGEIRALLQPYIAAIERRPDRMLYNYI